ncbi:MAG: SdpI family protein [Butyricicoccus sp.]|nr:SdpI family protein [Butyricicoccus sp.]
MSFWAFMLIMTLLIPLTLIGFGKYFLETASQKINSAFGYRTSMSMKNRDTWEFAHKYCGRIWFVCGIVLLPASFVSMLFTFGREADTVGIWGGIVCFAQLIPVFCSIFFVERAMKKTFDADGNRLYPEK